MGVMFSLDVYNDSHKNKGQINLKYNKMTLEKWKIKIKCSISVYYKKIHTY